MRGVVDPEVAWDAVYPPDKPFRTLYSLGALSKAFEVHRLSDEKLEIFARNSGPKLASFIAHSDADQMFAFPSLDCLSRLLNYFYVLLIQAVPLDSFDGLTDSPNLLVQKLFDIIQRCSDDERMGQKQADDCVCNAINLLFEGSKVDGQIWEAFQKVVDDSWVYTLIVSDPRVTVRGTVRLAINRLCSSSQSASRRYDQQSFTCNVGN